MQTRSAAGIAALLLLSVAAVGVPTPVAAHINHIDADSQVSPDGTLVVESVYIGVDGFLVAHRDDGGESGEPVGHIAVGSEGGVETDVRVTVDGGVWDSWDSGVLRLVLHRDDGDGEFDPADDRPIQMFGQTAGRRITVEKGERALVVAAAEAPQRTDEPNVIVRNAWIPRDGQLLVRNATSGRVLGRVELSAGRHKGVRVALNESAVEGRDRLTLEAVVAGPDGEPVTAGGELVATRFSVRYADGDKTTASPTPAVVRTATGAGGERTDGGTPPQTSEAITSQPGFGGGVGVAALTVGALLARRRR